MSGRYPKGSKVIRLTQGYECIVDAEMYKLLSQISWHIHHSRSGVYARGTLPKGPDGKRRKVYMHRLIKGLYKGRGFQVDHLNRRTLDNRVSNLQIVTQSENQKNRRGWAA